MCRSGGQFTGEKQMATPKKKHLIELMIEAGVKWPDGAEYAAQDNEVMYKVCFYKTKPVKDAGMNSWSFRGYVKHSAVALPSLCRNWHQTIVTREQYAEAVAAVTPDAQREARESDGTPAGYAVERHNPPSIEQLTADYHTKAAEADRLQVVADDALKAADDALLALEKAGELIGLVISIDTKPKQVEQLEITDWRDLRIGDVVEHMEYNGGHARVGSHGVVRETDDQYIAVDYPEHKGYIYSVPECQHKFRFIRRP